MRVKLVRGLGASPSRLETDIRKMAASLEFYDGLLFCEYSVKLVGERVQTWMMTTPNACWLPSPPESRRSVRLRTDGFFGPDDPCLWPQLLYPGHEHLACIRMNDPDPNSGVSFCRNGLSVERDGDQTQDGSYRLNSASYARCSTHTVILIERTKNLVVNDRSTLKKLVTLLRNALIQLKIFVGIPRHLKYRFAVFSRLYLELEAYINYHTITSASLALKEAFIGTFTLLPDQANVLYQQGIHVWYIRSKKTAVEESPRLLQTPHPKTPGSEMPWFVGQVMALGSELPLEPFFVGPVGDSKYLAAVREWNLRYTFNTASQAWSPQHDTNTSSITKPHHLPTSSGSNATGKRRTQDGVRSTSVEFPNKRQRKRFGHKGTLRRSMLQGFLCQRSLFMTQPFMETLAVRAGSQGCEKLLQEDLVSLN